MTSLLSVPPALFVALALCCVPLVSRKLAHAIATVALSAVVAWALVVPEGTGTTVTFIGFELIVVNVDSFSRLMAIIFGAFGASAVAFAYFADASKRHLLWGLGYVTASLWTVMVGDWLGLIAGWEAMAIASTIFVWLSGGDAIRAGYRYALAHALGGSILLAGLLVHLAAVGVSPTALHFDGTGISGLEIGLAGVQFSLAALLAGIGIGINAAIIGFHSWLPDTYPRPHVATSVFLACYTTKTAVYAAYRAFPEGNLALAYMGGAMAIYGAAFALAQKDMRRLLSYHIQGQVGFMLVGIGVGSSLGIAGAFAHLFNHILYKGLLFMAAGIIIIKVGQEALDKYGAVGTSAPIALGAFLVGALSISGVPLFNGFVSKGLLKEAVVAQELGILEWMLVLGSIGTFASFIKFGYYAFLYGEPIEMPDADLGHTVVAGSVAVSCIALGIFYQPLFAILPFSDQWSMDPYTTSKLFDTATFAAGGLIVFVAGKPLFDRMHGGIDVNRGHDPLAFYGTRGLSGGLGRLYNGVDRRVVSTGWTLVAVAQDPAPVIRRRLPAGWHDRYDSRLTEIPGKTGAKLGIGPTIYVATGVLLVVLGLALGGSL